MMKTTLSLMIALTAATGLFAAPASADGLRIVRNEHVSYADLDLRNPADAAQLDARILKASRRVCSPEGINLGSSMEENMAVMRCRKVALANARTKAVAAIASAQNVAMIDKPLAIAAR